MNAKAFSFVLPAFMAIGPLAVADTLYVDVSSTNPVPPYTNWSTAANVIQDAVDAATNGDTVLVTDGVYDTGGKVVWNTMTRVAVDKQLTLISVNGPHFTTVKGYQVPGTTNGTEAVRCAYLANGAFMAGFTLTEGATRGTSRYESQKLGASGGGLFCASPNAWASNCVLIGNSARQWGAGAYSGTLFQCVLSDNHCYNAGYSWSGGGGAYGSVLNTCLITGNSADTGGGTRESQLSGCTVVGNTALRFGGGAYHGSAKNSLIFYNHAAMGNNYRGGTLNHSCTTPLPTDGIGNIDATPQLASASHLSSQSPCIGAGHSDYATGTDIDGQPWASPPSIGCDEFWTGSATGQLSAAISADYTNVAVGFEVDLMAQVTGQTSASVWDVDDGSSLSNEPWVSRTWTSPGDYPIKLTAYNDTYPSGVSSTVIVQVVEQPVHHVAIGATNPVPPYASWATAATNIQDAIDVASVVGAQVLVSDGVYKPDGRVVSGDLTNRVVVDKPLELRSVNGPAVTKIEGEQRHFVGPPVMFAGGPRRCVWLGSDAVFSGFTVTNGAAFNGSATLLELEAGGGIWCQSRSVSVSNCVITANDGGRFGGGVLSGTLTHCVIHANESEVGGGAHGSILNNCLLTENLVPNAFGQYYGGGADVSRLNSCTLVGNVGRNGGGVASSEVRNSIVMFNTGIYANHDISVLDHCATLPLPTSGTGNITNAPLFVDTNSWADLRLSSNSPCINAGSNAGVIITNDLDGNPRIVGGTVDMGAYEFQDPQSLISYAYLQQYGLPTDGSADDLDDDGDKATTWQEWKMWTIPTNELSVLKMLRPEPQTNGTEISWQSVDGHSYTLERATNSVANFSVLQSGIASQGDTTTFTDTMATNGDATLYRVSVPE